MCPGTEIGAPRLATLLPVLVDKRKRNEILEAIVAAGHDPQDFDDDYLGSGGWLEHLPTGARLKIHRSGAVWSATWEIGDREGELLRTTGDWSGMVGLIPRWIQEAEEDAALPDLWAELEKTRDVLDLEFAEDAEDDDNSMFTAAEQSEIAKQLDEIRQYAGTALQLSEQQMNQLNGRLLYLQQAAERVGRKDWRVIAFGTLVTMAMEAIIPANELHNVVSVLLAPLTHLFGHPLQLPPG